MRHAIENIQQKIMLWIGKSAWPDRNDQLLIGAIIKNNDEARLDWRTWKSKNNFDNISWGEHKLFVHLAARMSEIDPTCELRPRIEGMAKSHWTRSQLILHASQKAIDILLEKKIEVMLLKGSAMTFVVDKKTGPHVSGDIDILVKRESFKKAIEILYKEGWHSLEGSMEAACLLSHLDSGVNLTLGPYGNIDVHHQPFKGQRMTDDMLDGLWMRATPVTLGDKKLYVPSMEDMILIQSVHGAQAKKEHNANWVMGLATMLNLPTCKPQELTDLAVKMKIVPEITSALLFIKTLRPNLNIDTALKFLNNESAGLSAWASFYLRTLKGNRINKSLLRVLLPKEMRFEKQRQVIPRVHPHPFQKRLSQAITLPPSCLKLNHHHHVVFSEKLKNKKCVMIELAFNLDHKGRYRFDVVDEYGNVVRFSKHIKKAISNERSFFFRYPIKKESSKINIISLSFFNQQVTAEKPQALPFKILSISY